MGEVHLTEDEAQLYDRQIRLWGIESQKSLRNAKILIICMNGLGAEVAKNIILSGVKSVSFLDNVTSSESECFSQFLIPREKIGINRAEASIERAQDLNPLVAVTAIQKDPSTIQEEDIKPYDVVVAIEQDVDTLISLNSICRENKIKYFSADVFGLFGYFFTDLQEHEYIMEIPKATKNSAFDKTEKQTRVENFPSFKEALDIDFSTDENSPLLHRMEPSYFVFRMLMKFRKEHKRNPTDSEEDFNILSDLRDKEISPLSYSKDKISDDFLRSCVGYPIAPVCAITGAMIAQEIIKAVSHRDHPLKNMFFFNPLNNIGHVQLLSV